MLCALFLCALALCPGRAWGDSVSGFLDITESITTIKDQPLGQSSSSLHSSTLSQRYSLALDKSFYPTLRLTAGGLYEIDSFDQTLNGVSSSSHTSQLSPNATLTFGNALISSSVGYSKSEVSTVVPGVISPTLFSENYTARVSMVPEGLPSVDLRFSRSNAYSSDRSQLDTSTDSYSISTRYRPSGNLDLVYMGIINDSTDNVSQSNSQTTSQTVTGRYYTRFLNNRVNFYSSATLSDNGLTSSSSTGSGLLTTLLPRLAGFYAVSDTPQTVPRSSNDSNTAPPVVTWTSVPSLVDADKRTATNPIINLGVPPIIGGDLRQRNIGLDLSLPSTLNVLYLYVNQNLPSTITGQYSWTVYTSADNENWTLQPAAIRSVIFEQVFDPLTQSLVQRFTFNLAEITTRYIKVVTKPLAQQPPPAPTGVDLANILVTEMEAAQSSTAAQSHSLSTSTQSGAFATGLQANILDNPAHPSLGWDMNVNYNFTKAASYSDIYLVTSGLTSFQKFNDFLSGTARVAVEEQAGSTLQSSTDLVYSASLEAHTLPTLSDTLTYSGRKARENGQSSTSNAISLTNTAALYQGVSANLAAGASTSTLGGSTGTSTYLNVGLSVIPHPTLTTNVTYSGAWSNQSGANTPTTQSVNNTASFQAVYTPVQAVSLFGAIGYSAVTGTPSMVTQNYGGSWSPFRDGDLQVSLAYNESRASLGSQRIRDFTPSLRWNIRPGWWLTSSYSYQTTDSAVQNNEVSSFSTDLRMAF